MIERAWSRTRAAATGTLVILSLTAIAIVAFSSELTAQVGVGARVRVTAPDLQADPLVGSITAISSDTIRMRLDATIGEDRIIPMKTVERIEFSQGRNKWYPTAGALIGIGAGVALGFHTTRNAVYGYGGCGWFEACLSSEEQRSLASLGYALLFGGLGALTGAIIAPERWDDALWNRVRVSLASGRGGRGLTLSANISF